MAAGGAPVLREEGGGPDVGVDEVGRLLAEPGRRYVVTSHRNPDGDAIGSMLGMTRALRAAGRDAVMWHADADPVPADLAFMLAPGERILRDLPADAGERTLLALDCASGARVSDGPARELAGLVVNLDHHHDNTGFGHLNLIAPDRSSTAELVADVLEAAGLPLTREIAEPLYVGMVTDTGRFGYSNTTPAAHRVAARLQEAGADTTAIHSRLYESLPLEQALLLGRGLAAARVLLDGRLIVSVLSPEDFAATGAAPTDTEGIVEALRAVHGIEVAAFARPAPNSPGALRVSLRAADGRVDVSEIARLGGGGGHRAAAGFSIWMEPGELVDWLRPLVARQLEAAAEGAPE